MALTPEWRGRIEQWQNTLNRLFYSPLGMVEISGFTTKDQLAPEEALRRKFKPMPTGLAWGAKWEYAWFKGSLKLPPEAKGKRIVLNPGKGHYLEGDWRLLVNGRETGGYDCMHQHILLAASGKPGAKYAILGEAYASHGPTVCGGGPSAEGEETVPEPGPTQKVMAACTFGIWEEELYQLWLDAQTLLEIRDSLDANSLRVAEIDAGLRDFTVLCDVELPRAELLAGARAARRRLQPLLACRNGSTAPRFYCFGHSHIDVAWLWPLAETERKCARTFSTQLELMDEYPEFKFLQSQPHLYRMTKRCYPRLYARIKQAVKRGQWVPEGGMWVEADTNISGGESLIRQFIHGKRFFREEFGIESRLMWLPDVFGYSGAMPQIMVGCGMRYFSTQKIFWTYNGGDCFPYNTFWWEGIDGTRILSHIHNDYNSQTNPKTMMHRWAERVQKDGLVSRLIPFGHGDGGGGPTRDHLEFLRRQKDLEGAPKSSQTSPLEFFKAEEARLAKFTAAAGMAAAPEPLPAYVGELYFQAHRGTYTTQAKTKKGNRRCEFALREAEMWISAARCTGRLRFPAARLDEAWKGVLLNQFHDIIPGSSIHRVYEEAAALHARVLATAHEAAGAAVRVLTKPDAKSLAVFNSLNWERTALVPLPKGWQGAALNGVSLPAQKDGAEVQVEVAVPPCGWVSLRPAAPSAPARALAASPDSLENEYLRLKFNRYGEISSLVDKETGWEYAAAPLNSFRLYKDVPRWFDAWDIDSTYRANPVALSEPAVIKVVNGGPLTVALRLVRRIGGSQLAQEIVLRRNSRRVEFRTQITWREKHKLLKVNFPTTLQANEALHEIQFGHLARPNHASRPFDADRFEVSNHKWTALCEANRGAAVLNDCKYGLNVDGGSINLTLLRSPLAPDMTADQGIHEFTYAFLVWNGGFEGSPVVREAYELNTQPLVAIGASGFGTLFTVDAPNIVIETVKPAEDGSGDIIVRLYESKRATTRCTLLTTLPVRKVSVTNMLEQNGPVLDLANGRMKLMFRPFEIKTLRLTV